MTDKILSWVCLILLVLIGVGIGVGVSYLVAWLLCKGIALAFGFQANVWGVTLIIIAINLLISAGRSND